MQNNIVKYIVTWLTFYAKMIYNKLDFGFVKINWLFNEKSGENEVLSFALRWNG